MLFSRHERSVALFAATIEFCYSRSQKIGAESERINPGSGRINPGSGRRHPDSDFPKPPYIAVCAKSVATSGNQGHFSSTSLRGLAMAHNRSWSSTTLQRGIELASNQCLDVKRVAGMPMDDQLLAMEEELKELEACVSVSLTMFRLAFGLVAALQQGVPFLSAGTGASSQGDYSYANGSYTWFRPWQHESAYSFDKKDLLLRASQCEQPRQTDRLTHTHTQGQAC